MQERIFRFDIPSHEWTECTEDKYGIGAPECVPTIVILNRQDAETLPIRQVVWCEKHHAYEDVNGWEDDTLTTDAGCRMWGFAAEVTQYGRPRHETAQKATFCWRVVCRDDGTVFIGAGNATVWMRKRTDPISKERIFIPQVKAARSEGLSLPIPAKRSPSQGNVFPIPSVIADAAIEYLREKEERARGRKIALPPYSHRGSFADGTIRLFAFLHDPLHMALWYYRGFFQGSGTLKRAIPCGDEDIFPYLCEAVGCEPTEAMRARFGENPIFPATAALLKYLGVREESLQLRFSSMRTFFGESPADALHRLGQHPFSPSWQGTPPSNIFADAEAAHAFMQAGNGSNSEWTAMLLYCRWRLFHEGEERLAEHLYDMNVRWDPRFMDAARVFYGCWPDMPDTMRSDLLREGLTEKMHNRMIRLANEKGLGRPDFSYPPEAKGYECRIGDYVFRLIDSRAELHSLLWEVGVLDWEKQLGARDNGILRVAMYRKEKIAAVIILDGQANLRFDGHYNEDNTKLQSAQIRIAFLRWLKWTGLYQKYEPFYETDYAYLREDVRAEPLAGCPSRLWDMFFLPEEGFRPGDYIRLYQMLIKAKLSCFVTPPREAFPTEMEYLMQVFPYGQAIYRAALADEHQEPFEDAEKKFIMQLLDPGAKPEYREAFTGNREAAYVLSLLYDDWDSPLPKDTERSKYWKTIAEEGRLMK